MAEDLGEKVLTIVADKFNELVSAAEKATPVAINAVLTVVSINVIQNIVGGLVVLIICLVSSRYFHIYYGKYKILSYGDREMEGVITIASLAVAVISGLISGIILLNVWNWVGVFHPNLYLVHELVNKVTEK
jgi:hypothetical protein